MARQTGTSSTERPDRVVRNGAIPLGSTEMPRPAETCRRICSETASSGTWSSTCERACWPSPATAAIAAMNDMAYRVLALPAGEDYIGRPFAEVLARRARSHPGPAAGVRQQRPPQPRGNAAPQDRPRDGLHALPHSRRRRPDGRRDDVLQGSDARRADRRARAPARPAGGAGRDGGGHRARSQESAREHRGHGRRAQAPDDRPRGSARDAERHHQRSEDGQRHRRRSARVRPADSVAGRARGARRGA